MICPNCGTECKSGVFCRICGERLPAVNPPETAAAPEPAPAPEPVPVFEPVPVSVPEPAPKPAARTPLPETEPLSAPSANGFTHPGGFDREPIQDYRQQPRNRQEPLQGGPQPVQDHREPIRDYRQQPLNRQQPLRGGREPARGYGLQAQDQRGPWQQSAPEYPPQQAPQDYPPQQAPGYGQGAPYGGPGYGQGAPYGGQGPDHGRGPDRSRLPAASKAAIQAVRDLAGSPLFLVATAAFTLCFVCCIISTIQLFSLISNLGGSPTVTLILGVAAALLPMFLLTLGMWLTFGSGLSKARRMPTAGLTIIKVVLILALVVFCVAFAALMLADLGVMILGQDVLHSFGYRLGPVFREFDSITLALGIALAALAAIFVLGLLFLCKAIKTVNTVKRTAATGVPSDLVSPFVAVMLFLACGGILTLAVFSFLAADYLTGAALVFAAVSTVCFAILIFLYRGRMRSLGVYHGLRETEIGD